MRERVIGFEVSQNKIIFLKFERGFWLGKSVLIMGVRTGTIRRTVIACVTWTLDGR